MSKITSYCRISNSGYTLNDHKVSLEVTEELDSLEFVSSLYKKMDCKYPKFHKMDLLAKTAFLGVELMLSENDSLKKLEDDEIALCFANKESSSFSDTIFLDSYTQGSNPSPSQFVYTLPNILIGELAIKNKWYGENLFLIFNQFDEIEFSNQINLLLNSDSKACVCGWVNVMNNKLDAFFFVVEQDENKYLDVDKLKKLYNK